MCMCRTATDEFTRGRTLLDDTYHEEEEEEGEEGGDEDSGKQGDTIEYDSLSKYPRPLLHSRLHLPRIQSAVALEDNSGFTDSSFLQVRDTLCAETVRTQSDEH